MSDVLPPQESDTSPETPFAGRRELYARLQQRILDPPDRHALVFTGHPGIGKTAFLKHVAQVFDDRILSVYIPLEDADLSDSFGWIRRLMSATRATLAAHDYSLSRIPQEEDGDMALDAWFGDVFLTDVLALIRAGRRLVWLLDDAQYLLNGPESLVNDLHHLLQTHGQLAIVLTLDTLHEERLNDLAPLVNPVSVERLHRLTSDETADVIRQFAPGAGDSVVEAVYADTGGQPRLVQHVGRELRRLRASKGDDEALGLARGAVYDATQGEFRSLWRNLNQDERLVLTAIASLIYDNPLRPLNAKDITAWLIETDYPLDSVAVNAALRGLEYQDIVTNQGDVGLRFVSGLMQTWLLDHARLDNDDVTTFAGQISWRALLVIVAVIALLVFALLALPTPLLNGGTTPIPTVTLEQ